MTEASLLLRLRRSPQRLHAMAYDRDRGKGGDLSLHRNGGVSVGNGSSGITICWGDLRLKMIDGWYHSSEEAKAHSRYYLLFGHRIAIFAGWFF